MSRSSGIQESIIDVNSLRKLLHETVTACQKCLAAISTSSPTAELRAVQQCCVELEQQLSNDRQLDGVVVSQSQQCTKGSVVQPSSGGGQSNIIQLLEEQAKQFRSDFELEKRDRLAAQAKVNELQAQLADTTRQMQQLSLQTMQNLAERREAALAFHRDQYQTDGGGATYHHHASDSGNSPHHAPAEGYDEIDAALPPHRPLNGEDCI
jgi:hypothetical protein